MVTFHASRVTFVRLQFLPPPILTSVTLRPQGRFAMQSEVCSNIFKTCKASKESMLKMTCTKSNYAVELQVKRYSVQSDNY